MNESSREQLRRMTTDALEKARAKSSQDLREGSVCVLGAGRDDAIFWVLIEREPALFAAADQHPLQGPCDLEIGSWPTSWTVRCEFTVRFAEAPQSAVIAATLPAEAPALIRVKLGEIERGALRPSERQEEALLDPEYQDLQERLAAACGELTDSASAYSLTLRLVSDDLDPERLDELTTYLWRELRELPFIPPERLAASAPAGARTGAAPMPAFGWTRRPEDVERLLEFLRDWLRRVGSSELELHADEPGKRRVLKATDE